MRSRLERVAESAIRNVVIDNWGLAIGELGYFPEGGGAYHWITRTDDARRWFLTCDDLDTKPWLGHDRDSVFDGLLSAYGTAADLRTAGLRFVVAPVPAASGLPAVRVDERHSVSVLEYVDGEAGRWGRPVSSQVRAELVTMLAQLHRSTTAARNDARRGLELPGRDDLEEALDDLDHPWDGGPLSEPARRELRRRTDFVVRRLDDLDRFSARLGSAGDDAAVTHGEPHPGNLIRTADGLILLDWDTVAPARPERDLWMIVDDDETVATAYHDMTGTTLDPEALAAYRLLWGLSDIVAVTVQLRAEHEQGADADRALAGLRRILDGQEPSPYGTRR